MTPSPRPTPGSGWEKPGPEPETRSFTQADLDVLAKLLRDDARGHATPPRPKRTTPPNIGTNLAVLLTIVLVTLFALAGLIVWLAV